MRAILQLWLEVSKIHLLQCTVEPSHHQVKYVCRNCGDSASQDLLSPLVASQHEAKDNEHAETQAAPYHHQLMSIGMIQFMSTLHTLYILLRQLLMLEWKQ